MNKDRETLDPAELAFDIDGVFADTFRAFIRTARREYGILLEYDEITEYDFWNLLDIDEKICEEIVKRILDDPLEMGIVPVEGAVEVLTRLSFLNRVLFVTARSEEEAIRAWIAHHMPHGDMSAIQLVATGAHEEKLPALRAHGIRYFVEDRLETCYLLHRESVDPIVFEQPWNRKPHPFHRVRTWEEIAALIHWEPQERLELAGSRVKT